MPAVTATAKLAKLNNRKSKRDIEREIRIAQKGGVPIEVFYGRPLSDEERQERVKIEHELRYAKYDKELKQIVPKTRNSYRQTGGDRSSKSFIKSVLRSAKARAEKLGIPFDLVANDLSIPEVCPIFGTPLIWTDRITNDTPSLDRLIPEKGYVKDNVAFISMRANRLKSDASLEDLEKIVEWIKRNQ